MSTTAVPLQTLAQRINQHEAELAQLRKAFETRQAQLTELTHRKEQLVAQLQQVEAEIQAAGSKDVPASKPAPAVSPAKAAPAAKTAPAPKPTPAAAPKAAPGQTVTLPQLLVQLVRQAQRPVTIKELAEQVVQSKYPTTTRNIPQLVKSRVGELLRKGVFRRLAEQPGVVLAKAPPTTSPAAKPSTTTSPMAKTGSAVPPNGPKKMPTTGLAVPHKPAASATTPPNKSVVAGPVPALAPLLVKLLANSQRPLKARELAEQAKAVGYKTTSRDFTNVVWVAVGKLKNVENIKGQGYRLKKGKSSNPGK
jgi:hypothetical protein